MADSSFESVVKRLREYKFEGDTPAPGRYVFVGAQGFREKTILAVVDFSQEDATVTFSVRGYSAPGLLSEYEVTISNLELLFDGMTFTHVIYPMLVGAASIRPASSC